MSLFMFLAILCFLMVFGGIIFFMSKPPIMTRFDQKGEGESPEAKGLFRSKTFWAALVTLAVALFGRFGIDIESDTLMKAIEAIILVVTTILTIAGRKAAKTPINGLVGRR